MYIEDLILRLSSNRLTRSGQDHQRTVIHRTAKFLVRRPTGDGREITGRTVIAEFQ